MTGSFALDAVFVKPPGLGAQKVEVPGFSLSRHRPHVGLRHRPGGWMRSLWTWLTEPWLYCADVQDGGDFQ
jgi:hypothetical protein